MGEKELRDLIPIQAEWSIPQLQENIAVALEGSGAALSTTQTQAKAVSNEVALVVNTSGSTGDSKSVVLSSAALIASANASHKSAHRTRLAACFAPGLAATQTRGGQTPSRQSLAGARPRANGPFREPGGTGSLRTRLSDSPGSPTSASSKSFGPQWRTTNPTALSRQA